MKKYKYIIKGGVMYYHIILKYLYNLLIIFCVVLSLQACTGDEENADPVSPTIYERGEIVQTNSLGTITVNDIQQILANANIVIPFTLSYSVETISMKYYTVDGSR